MSTLQSSTPVRWIAKSAEDLVWARLDEDYVAYHRPSGKTHLLNGASHRLLRETLTTPLDLSTVVRETLDSPDGDPVPSLLGEMESLLEHLERLDLVERV